MHRRECFVQHSTQASVSYRETLVECNVVQNQILDCANFNQILMIKLPKCQWCSQAGSTSAHDADAGLGFRS